MSRPEKFQPNKIYRVLKIVDRFNRSNHDLSFIYPKKGIVKVPDSEWNPKKECGGGLHAYLNKGIPDFSACFQWGLTTRKYLVIEVLGKNMINLGRKVKFKEGNVIYCGRDPEKVFELLGDFTKNHEKGSLVYKENVKRINQSHYFSRKSMTVNGKLSYYCPFFEAKTFIKLRVEYSPCYVKSGTGQVFVGNDLVKLRKNQIYCFNGFKFEEVNS